MSDFLDDDSESDAPLDEPEKLFSPEEVQEALARYEAHKADGNAKFSAGDFDGALVSYSVR